jgi:hypothetical protein
MRLIPQVEYGDPGHTVTLSFTYPQRLWTPSSSTVGGTNTSAAGVVESFVIRRDQMIDVRLVFAEREWPAVLAWIAWAQDSAGTFRFWPDATAPSDVFICWLESPKVGEEVRPERGEFSPTYEITLKLRSADGAAFDVRAYE